MVDVPFFCGNMYQISNQKFTLIKQFFFFEKVSFGKKNDAENTGQRFA